MDELIQSIMSKWGFEHFKIVEQFNEESQRVICKIITDKGKVILKGIPDNITEDVIKGNIRAHEYLGNEKYLAPKLIYQPDGISYLQKNGYYFYVIEYIQGRLLQETIEDEYALGQVVKKLHSFTDYDYPCGYDSEKQLQRFYGWFSERSFKKKFDEILDSLPNFKKYEQCFIHTDLGPHNAMMGDNREVVLIDLDDSGIGSKYLDLGWPFIMQFVDFNHETHEIKYQYEIAMAFLQGYYKDRILTIEEYDLIWSGAIFMHISYMQCYGQDAVDSLWDMLNFGIQQKERLWNDWFEKSAKGMRQK